MIRVSFFHSEVKAFDINNPLFLINKYFKRQNDLFCKQYLLYLLWLLIGLQRVKGSDVFYQFQRRNNTIFYFSRLCGYKEIASRFSPRLFRARVSEPYPNTSILIWTCLLARCSYRYSFICSWNSSVLHPTRRWRVQLVLWSLVWRGSELSFFLQPTTR